MKLLRFAKDGGPESHVRGFFAVEIKHLFSIVLLHFAPGSREAFHSHAFDAVSWVLRGHLTEHLIEGGTRKYRASFRPVITRRTTFHKVVSDGHTWVLSFRGPWVATWREHVAGRYLTLTHGRVLA